MNKVYLYDGKFKSLLVLVFNLIKFKKTPLDIKSEDDYEANLIDKPVYVNVNFTSKIIYDLISYIIELIFIHKLLNCMKSFFKLS